MALRLKLWLRRYSGDQVITIPSICDTHYQPATEA